MRYVSFLARYWFPLALGALFLLAVPGLILLALNLMGADGPVNDWLEENFQLSYHLALPGPLALILLLIIPAIILLYFLKLKRKPLEVPSTFLWRKSIEDLHVNSLFQWLRENILLILQVLAVLILIYAVLGFRFHGSTTRGRHYILILDNSASMSANDVSPSRLHWAKQEATKEIDAAGDDDFGMVIVFNSKATTLQTYTSNRSKLRQAVQSIEQTHRPTRIDEALNLADSLANPARSTEDVASRPEGEEPGKERTYVPPQGIASTIHLYSDGRFANLSEAMLAGLNSRLRGNTSVLGNLNLKYHMAGGTGPESTDNIGIVAFNALQLAGETAKTPNPDVKKLQILVRVRNYRFESAAVKLRLDVVAGGKIIFPEQKLLQIPERKLSKGEGEDAEAIDEPGEKTATFILPPLDLRTNIVLHAYLENANDAFPLDDEAWLVVGTVRKAKVLIVGRSNPVLEAFFDQEATKRVAKVEHIPAGDLTKDAYRQQARSGQVDLVIFDRCAPADESDMPQANTFFIDRPPPPWQRSSVPLKNPYLVVSKKDQPLLKHLTTLWDVGVNEAFRFDIKNDLGDKAKGELKLPDSDPKKRVLPPLTRLIEAGAETPLLFTLPRGAYTDLVMTFPLINAKGDLTTNWPLQPSFPLFLRNVLYHLGNVADVVGEASVQPGEPMILRPEAGVQWLKVTPSKGEAVKLSRGQRADFTYGATDSLGVYQVARDDGGQRSFAVNLLDANESHIEPKQEIHIGSERFSAGQERKQPLELWKWIILLALILLLLEWYIYNRRVYI
jgi:hypothetical protein